MQDDDEQAPQTQGNQKKSWLLTYGAAGPMLNADMFKKYKDDNQAVILDVNECYTTSDQAVKYTLVHLVDRKRQSTVEKFMAYASQKYGIVWTEVFGYAGITANNSSNELYKQPGFKILFDHKMENNPAFNEWVQHGVHGGGILETYKRKQARAGTAAAQNQGTTSPDDAQDAGQKRGSEGGGGRAPKRLMTTIIKESVLPDIQTADSLPVDSSESDSIKMALMASAMEKMAAEIDRLTAENIELRVQQGPKLDTLIAFAEKTSSDMDKIKRNSEPLITHAEKTLSGVEKLQRDAEILISHAEKTSSDVEQIVSGQAVITDNQIDSSFLVSSLGKTTHDRDGLRITVRSQAGKMGAVKKKLRKIEKKLSKIEAERMQTVERSEVIDEIRKMGIGINQDNRRAEKRLASHMGIPDQPLGDPFDNYPYSEWTDELCDEFRVKLKNNYEQAPEKIKRRDLPPLEDYPDAAKSRLFQYGLGVILSNHSDSCNLENSPAKHRYDLVKLSGPIFDENVVEKLRKSFEIQVKYLCIKLSRPYVENREVYPLMEGDAFLSSEMEPWKLACRYSGSQAEFNKFKKLIGDVVKGHCYSDEVYWRYYTLLHMTGTSTRIVEEEHVANLDCISIGSYYSKATVNSMETDYLTSIAELKTQVSSALPEDDGFDNAAREVISRMHSTRQNSRSKRPGKINNKKRT